MPTLALPADTVRFYDDGPDWPKKVDAERAYRHAFLAGAQECCNWETPDLGAIENAWEDRQQARDAARVLVRSADLFGIPHLHGKQIVYRTGHEIAASRTRGRCQALELAKETWFRLCDARLTDEQICDSVIKPWVKKTESWAKADIDTQRISPPPRPEQFITETQQRMLEPKPKVAATLADKPLAITRRLTNVQRELLDWLWPGRIPLGKLTLLAGDPGLGKSFVTLDIAARVSRGDAWPDMPLNAQSAAGVLLFNAEDDLADTIAPRLDKAGANDQNIVAIEGVSFLGQRRHFSLEADLPRLVEVIEQNPGTRLVVIDPISAYTGKIDSHNNTDVRGLLAPLADLAGRYRLAILAVTHLSKTGGAKAVYRPMGSLAFAAAARAVWAIVKDREDPLRRLFLPAKLNLSEDPNGLAYRIVEGRIAWEPDPVRMHADQAFAAELRLPDEKRDRGSERNEAADWLLQELASGPRPAADIIEIGEQIGFNKRTLRRAYNQLGGDPKKESFCGHWIWQLPDPEG